MSLATYWLIAVPPPSSKGGNKTGKTAQELADDAALLRRSVDMKTEKLSQSFTFHIPKLKVHAAYSCLCCIAAHSAHATRARMGFASEFARV